MLGRQASLLRALKFRGLRDAIFLVPRFPWFLPPVALPDASQGTEQLFAVSLDLFKKVLEKGLISKFPDEPVFRYIIVCIC